MDNLNFYDRMMNIQARPASMIVGSVSTYARGHMNARHDAAKIAFEADARIKALEALVQDMAGALDGFSGRRIGFGQSTDMRSLREARQVADAALAKHKEVMG